MRLATIDNSTRDGQLVVVNHEGTHYAEASSVAPTLQAALDAWSEAEPKLRELAAAVEAGGVELTPLGEATVLAPLPRAYEWIDGSAYINHIVLVRKARNAEPPETLETDPLVYQGGSGILLGHRHPVELADEAWGCDYEAEICVILGDTPQGTKADGAAPYIKLVMICNDVSLRNLIPGELKKGFGFFTSKPATAFAPFALTPDELGDVWQEGRLHLKMLSEVNGEFSGDPDAGPEMHFSFHQLLEHICKTRSFTAGTILGSGTVSNIDESRGVSCLAEKRMREIIETGEAKTRFLRAGDHVMIKVCNEEGRNLFGTIEQEVVAK